MIARILSTAAKVWQGHPRPPKTDALKAPTYLGDLSVETDMWHEDEGFHHLDWKRVAALIDLRARTEHDRELAWRDAAVQWLNRLKTELGSRFRLGESRNILLVSAKGDTSFRYFLGQCESALAHLRAELGELAWRWDHGKHAVLMFEDEDSYYHYLSHFHLDGGVYGTSSGVFLRGRGYCHTALAPQEDALPTLVHEFTHLCLSRFRLPLWLEEGLATHFERELTGRGAHKIDKESIMEQRAFWNADNIQEFWAGTSFRVGDERRRSYEIAEHLVTLLQREFRDLGPFIAAACREDAGQLAAREHLGLELSEIAAAFLGEGNWGLRTADAASAALEPGPADLANYTELRCTPLPALSA